MKSENKHRKTSARYARWFVELRANYIIKLTTLIDPSEIKKLEYRLNQLNCDIADQVADSILEENNVLKSWETV